MNWGAVTKKTRRLVVTLLLNSATAALGHGIPVSLHRWEALCSSHPSCAIPFRVHDRHVPHRGDESARLQREATTNPFSPRVLPPSQSSSGAWRAPGGAGAAAARVAVPRAAAPGSIPRVTSPRKAAFSRKRSQALEILYPPPPGRCTAALVSLLTAPFYSTIPMFLLPPHFNPETLPS